MLTCSGEGAYLSGASDILSDGQGIVNARFKCSDGEELGPSLDSPDDGWSDGYAECDPGSVVCGITTRCGTVEALFFI